MFCGTDVSYPNSYTNFLICDILTLIHPGHPISRIRVPKNRIGHQNVLGDRNSRKRKLDSSVFSDLFSSITKLIKSQQACCNDPAAQVWSTDSLFLRKYYNH